MKGVWAGVYAYESPARAKVSFTITIEEDRDGVFTGTVQDGAGGHEMPGKVSGSVAKDGFIRFLKTMPSTLLEFPTGEHEYLHGTRQKIDYRGSAAGEDSFSGIWTLRGGLRFFKGRLYFTASSHGPWRMTRVQ